MNLDLAQYKVSPLSMVFLVQNDQILVLRRAANKQLFPNNLSGFGCKIEPGEDLIAANHREFTEETGLVVSDLQLKGNFIIFMGNGFINVLYLFVATQFTGTLISNSDEGTISWMSIDDFFTSPDRVDHIGFYFKQIIKPNSDIYTGIAIRENGIITSYQDNNSHFSTRST